MIVANLYVIENTEDNKSFLCHKQINYDITAVLQIRVNTCVNPAELETAIDKTRNMEHSGTSRNME